MGVRVEGLRELVRDLQELGLEVDDLKDVFSEISRRGADIISQATPVLTGALRASVRGNRAKSKAVVRSGYASVPYAAMINYGAPKRGIPARMFMQAADQHENEFVQMLDQGIDKVLRKKGFK